MDENYVEGGFGKPSWIKDPESGEVLPIERDDMWRKAWHDFVVTECKHERYEPKRVRIADGRVQVMQCCIFCGERTGTAISQKNREWVESLPFLADNLIEGYRSRRAREKFNVMLDIARKQYAENGRFTESYRKYMASPEWKARRTKIMHRCNSVCEGCGERGATEVHHLTYQHFGAEFLFELVGLCAPCHSRYHAIDEEVQIDKAA